MNSAALDFIANDDSAETVQPTPLYISPRDASSPIRVKLVLGWGMPRWLEHFVELADAESWIEVSVHAVGQSDDGSPQNLCVVDPGGVSGVFPEGIEGEDADVLLVVGSAELASRVSDTSGLTCWWLDASLSDMQAPQGAMLAPILQGDASTTIELELASDGMPSVSLARSAYSTQFGSPPRQVAIGFSRLPTLLMRGLRQVASCGHRPTEGPESLRLKGAGTELGIGSSIRLAARSLSYSVRSRLARRRQIAPWVVALRNGASPLDPLAPTVDSPTMLVAPGAGFWADPCAVSHDGRRYVFVEEVTPSSRRGVIACLELIGSRAARKLGVALQEPCHLSYPQPFVWQGQWYMTVESGEAQRVSLYQAQEFPLRWRRHADLIVGQYSVDPTLHYHEGRWYLFANVAENGGSTWNELFLFVSDSLVGPFLPHPANPLIADVRCARPAGRIFEHEGRLIRPAQDCSKSYGAAVVFNEILELTPSRYREQCISRLEPCWMPGLERCHTYNRADGLEVLDAMGHIAHAAQRITIEGIRT